MSGMSGNAGYLIAAYSIATVILAVYSIGITVKLRRVNAKLKKIQSTKGDE